MTSCLSPASDVACNFKGLFLMLQHDLPLQCRGNAHSTTSIHIQNFPSTHLADVSKKLMQHHLNLVISIPGQAFMETKVSLAMKRMKYCRLIAWVHVQHAYIPSELTTPGMATWGFCISKVTPRTDVCACMISSAVVCATCSKSWLGGPSMILLICLRRPVREIDSNQCARYHQPSICAPCVRHDT